MAMLRHIVKRWQCYVI